MQFWEIFGKARQLLQERKEQLENGTASTGEKWSVYEKLKLTLRSGCEGFQLDEVSAKEEVDNVQIAHEILARLAGSCVLNSKHAGALERKKESFLDMPAVTLPKCLSCPRTQVAKVEGDSAFRGLFWGKHSFTAYHSLRFINLFVSTALPQHLPM